jgi:type III secretion protein J
VESNRSFKLRFERFRRGGLLATACLAVLTTGCLRQELVSGLDERESQEIIVLLEEHGLDGVREVVAQERAAPTWTVSVRGGEGNRVLAWKVMQENGLPREKVQGLGDVFAEQGMIPTSTQEKAKILVGLSGEMSRTLRSIKGVVDARVHVVLPEDNPLVDEESRAKPSASVLIKHHGDKPPISQSDVLRLVSKGVEGLKEDQIAVVFHKVEQTPVSSADVSWFPSSDELLVGALGLLAVLGVLTLVLLGRLRAQSGRVRQLEELQLATRETSAGGR